jgi:hypothetical protein
MASAVFCGATAAAAKTAATRAFGTRVFGTRAFATTRSFAGSRASKPFGRRTIAASTVGATKGAKGAAKGATKGAKGAAKGVNSASKGATKGTNGTTKGTNGTTTTQGADGGAAGSSSTFRLMSPGAWNVASTVSTIVGLGSAGFIVGLKFSNYCSDQVKDTLESKIKGLEARNFDLRNMCDEISVKRENAWAGALVKKQLKTLLETASACVMQEIPNFASMSLEARQRIASGASAEGTYTDETRRAAAAVNLCYKTQLDLYYTDRKDEIDLVGALLQCKAAVEAI